MLPMPAGRDASSGVRAPAYVRHRPERTLLYQLVEEHYPALEAQLAAQGTELPAHVQREFEAYLECGRLEHGFLRARCETCHAEHLVALTCHSYYASWVLAVVVRSAATRASVGSSYMNRPTSSRR